MLYTDSFIPSFSNSLLYGLEMDFLMLNCLVIAAMDRAKYLLNPDGTRNNDIVSGLALGILIAYLLDSFLIGLRSYYGKRNIARHVLVSDDKFMI